MTILVQPNTGANYPELMARLDRIDGLIQRAARNDQAPLLGEILNEWRSIFGKVRTSLASSSKKHGLKST